MSAARERLVVALVQMDAGTNAEKNIAAVEHLLLSGLSISVDLVALPEVFLSRGDDASYRASAQPVPGALTERLSALAQRMGAWLLAGTVIEKSDRLYNTSLLFDRNGRIAARYRKIHLFEAHLGNEKVIREKDVYEAGSEPVLVDVDGWKCGIGVCYDLRFPELFRYYSARGAELLLLPSNFTHCTGKDHWEILIRARAIENQCFVAAPDQCGTNETTGVQSHGHSLVVGPWGELLCDAGDHEGVFNVELDRAAIRETRRRIPALDHRRLSQF
jgi:deaminated glutathione amidase